MFRKSSKACFNSFPVAETSFSVKPGGFIFRTRVCPVCVLTVVLPKRDDEETNFAQVLFRRWGRRKGWSIWADEFSTHSSYFLLFAFMFVGMKSNGWLKYFERRGKLGWIFTGGRDEQTYSKNCLNLRDWVPPCLERPFRLPTNFSAKATSPKNGVFFFQVSKVDCSDPVWTLILEVWRGAIEKFDFGVGFFFYYKFSWFSLPFSSSPKRKVASRITFKASYPV